MATVTFDTLKFSDTLKAAGVPAAHAEAEARAVATAIGDVDVATRHDIDELRKAVKRDIDDLRKEVHNDMQSLELRLTIKLGTLMTVIAGIIIAVLRLPH